MNQTQNDELRKEAMRWYEEINRLQGELSRREKRRPGESDQTVWKRKRERWDRLFHEMARAAEAYSRVWQFGPVRKYPCPCCELHTLDEEPPGTYDICPVCGWEDDDVQFRDPDYRGGANGESLNEARAAYRAKREAADLRDSTGK